MEKKFSIDDRDGGEGWNMDVRFVLEEALQNTIAVVDDETVP
jgi:hypothetical protein